MNTNNDISEVVKKLISAINNSNADVPKGWFCRTDIETATNKSESQAIRYIRKMKKLKGFKETKFLVNGHSVNYYNVGKDALKTLGKKSF